jgi:uncharacterized protein with ParB-like and HNH nuclease domain
MYQFLEGSGKSFVIPVYQRDYAWTKVNCEKLWNDIIELCQHNRQDHFLGTLVTIGNSGFQEYTVIDGQQRLTTVSLFLKALHSYLEQKEERKPEEETLKERLLNDFLIDKYSSQKDLRIRLKPNKQDRASFEKLFENSEFESDSNIVTNFRFFLDKISQGPTPQELFEAFMKLKIVLINLDRSQDDPQLIFESLNSTGVDLTAGDLIRNYILMDLEKEEQEQMYKQYWVEIERKAGDVAEFVRNYLIFKFKSYVKKADVYLYFKRFATDTKEGILRDLLDFAEIYAAFVQREPHPSEKINKRLQRLHKLEFTVCYPFLLDCFQDYKRGELHQDTILQILQITESHAFRKVLVDNNTQGLNKMYVTLAREIKKEAAWKEQYVDILSYILREKRFSQRIPNDEEFENTLLNKEVYRLNQKNKSFLLESLENYNSTYRVDADELTIEHIMPQTLTSEWKERLGENWERVHQKYLHTLGNLTFTAKNTKLSNHLFENKQDIDFQTSKLKLNKDLEKIEQWDEQTIIARAKKLATEAMEIWQFPETDYIKQAPQEEIFDLTTEDSFSGLKPSRLFLEEEEDGIEVQHWRDLLMKVCNFLYDYSPTRFNEIENDGDMQSWIGAESSLRDPLLLRNNIFIEGNRNANSILSFLRQLSEQIGYSPENIQFSIKE